MIRKWPLIPTILVAAAVAAMIGLGIWQLERLREKEALISLYRTNLARPMVTFPHFAPVPSEAMFAPSSVMCLQIVDWRIEGGRAADGTTGYRHIASCRTGAEGPGALVDLGVSRDPEVKPQWTGGEARGIITTEPDHASVIARLFGGGVMLSPMLISNRPAPGLLATARPSPESVPNNHFGYAIQWFLFAAVAMVIYVLALRKRERELEPQNG
jgi:surfeit locus 1 family protein